MEEELIHRIKRGHAVDQKLDQSIDTLNIILIGKINEGIQISNYFRILKIRI